LHEKTDGPGLVLWIALTRPGSQSSTWTKTPWGCAATDPARAGRCPAGVRRGAAC